jgi:adenylyltransferase/sulfurtransferase
LALPGFGAAQLGRLRAASALVVGAGGLGAPVLTYLAAAGVGRLVIVDDDVVEEANLSRQVLFAADAGGRSKAAAAAERVRALNPAVEARAVAARLGADNVAALVAVADVVVDCSDNPPTRYRLNRAALAAGRPLVWGAIAQFCGRCAVTPAGRGPCWECLFGPQEQLSGWPTAAADGVFGPVCGVVGAWAAAETVKVITGLGDPLVSRMLLVDALTGETLVIPVQADPDCPACGRR